MQRVKMGLIGAGGIAQVHLRAIADLEEMEVIAVADVVKESADRTAQRWGIPHVYTDYREMLLDENIDAISVCTYNQAHREPTIDALEAGKHVILEKPMAATLDDALAIATAARRTDRLLMVAVKTRFRPQIIAAKAVSNAGTLGDVYYCETVGARRYGIPGRSFVQKATAGLGVVADMGVYSLDTALYIMGHPRPCLVSGIANNLLGTQPNAAIEGRWAWNPDQLEVEDFGVASVRFENGTMMVFKSAWIMHMDSLGGTFFLGTKAGLRLDPLTVYRHNWGSLTDTLLQGIPDVDNLELFRRENQAFAKAIQAGESSPIPADEMLLTNVIIQGLIDSAKAGHEVRVTVPEIQTS